MKKYIVFTLIGLFVVLGTNQIHAQANEQTQIDQVHQDLRVIGLAIEALFKDTGLMLIDLDDGTTAQGIKRIREDFDGVGLPQNGVRTLRDVLQPLVHLGYLDEVPTDPFIPEDAPPEWNTYVYVDFEVGLNGYYEAPFLTEAMHEQLNDNEWWLISPGSDQEFAGFLSDNNVLDLALRRFDLYMEPPLSEELIIRQQENFQILGNAISKFHQEQGVMLVDFWDDDYDGILSNRIINHFFGIGQNISLENRTFKEVYDPLIAFGYLDEIPVDPVLMPYPRPLLEGYNNGFLSYRDNDPEIEGQDWGGAILDESIEEGEWFLAGFKPGMSETPKPDRDLPTHIVSQEFANFYIFVDSETMLNRWQLH